MKWNLDKSLCPWHLKIVMCPWHLEMVTQFAHPVSRVSSHTFFLTADLPKSPWACLGPPTSFLGISVFPGCQRISFSENGPCRQLASHLHSFGNTLNWTPQSQCPIMVVWAESCLNKAQNKVFPDGTHEQDRVLLDWTQTKSLCLTLLPKVGQSGACWKSNIYPLYFYEITPLIIWHFEVGCQAATLYQLADGSAVLKLGLDGITRVSTYHGPHIGHQLLVMGFTFSLTRRWFEHWAHAIVD